jgi:hypothetical protein
MHYVRPAKRKLHAQQNWPIPSFPTTKEVPVTQALAESVVPLSSLFVGMRFYSKLTSNTFYRLLFALYIFSNKNFPVCNISKWKEMLPSQKLLSSVC